MTDATTPAWIQALRDALASQTSPGSVALIETHISWVLLSGRYAYKIKKPVNLGFLDFSTIEKRRRYCMEELRLNQRLAPQLYLDIVTINGSTSHPQISGAGPVIDYAVRMLEFPANALASTLLDLSQLQALHIDQLAATLAAFHSTTGAAAAGSAYGSAESIFAAADENFLQLLQLMPTAGDQTTLNALRRFTMKDYESQWTLFGARQAAGEVRECHGDLHLGNIVLLEGQLTPFDCIEFNPALRWIDVMSEVAFLMMDLDDHGRTDLAWRFLNAYLDITGARGGLNVLRFYLVYRAVVRAKIHAIRATQAMALPGEHQRLLDSARHYLNLATQYAQGTRPALILMHGLSGSGKSVAAQAIADQLGAVQLRSDVERKRLSGLTAQARSGSTLGAGLYTTDHTHATYCRLADLTRMALGAGWTTVVDATFLMRTQREQFRTLAAARNVRCVLVELTAPESLLRTRIVERALHGNDVSEADQAVLTAQLSAREPIGADESAMTLQIDSAQCDAVTVGRNAASAVKLWLHADTAATHPDSPNQP